jgi:reverse gyrase
MSLEFSLCNNCGGVFHPDEVEQGYCYNCSPDSGETLAFEEVPEINIDRMANALASKSVEVPAGMSKEELRQFIIAASNGDCV